MAKVKKPAELRAPAKIDDKFKLDALAGKIDEFVKYVKIACSAPSKENTLAKNRAKFLVRDLNELKKEKSLVSRGSAVLALYKDYNEYVKELPDEADEKEGMKNGDHPKKVILKGTTKCPTGCDADYHDKLITAMKKTATYSYTVANRSWTPDLGKQTGHADGKGWKAYVDAEVGKGTKWRMGFTMDFDEVDEDLTVTINYCKIGH